MVARMLERPGLCIAHNPMGDFPEADYEISGLDWERFDWDDFPLHSILVLDEIELICPITAPSSNTIRRILNLCRHRDYTIIAASRRPAAIHRDLTSFATKTYLFQTNEPRDIRFMREKYGDIVADQVMQAKRFKPIILGD